MNFSTYELEFAAILVGGIILYCVGLFIYNRRRQARRALVDSVNETRRQLREERRRVQLRQRAEVERRAAAPPIPPLPPLPPIPSIQFSEGQMGVLRDRLNLTQQQINQVILGALPFSAQRDVRQERRVRQADGSYQVQISVTTQEYGDLALLRSQLTHQIEELLTLNEKSWSTRNTQGPLLPPKTPEEPKKPPTLYDRLLDDKDDI